MPILTTLLLTWAKEDVMPAAIKAAATDIFLIVIFFIFMFML